MGSDATAGVQLNLSQDCQAGAASGLEGSICDTGGGIPAQLPGCPMMDVCLNMGAGSGVCGLVTVTDETIAPYACSSAAPVVFLRSAVHRTGLGADPVFHPPII